LDEKLEYCKPLRRLITSNAAGVQPSEIVNKSQSIVKNDQNMVGLIGIVAKDWFPNKYRIATLEELNAIGFDKHPEFKSISDYVYHYSHIILDCSFINKIRFKNEGFKQQDSLYAIELVQSIVVNKEGRIIIIVPSGFENFMNGYKDMCEGLSELGIECFRNGKYQPLVSKEKGKMEGNDEQ
jgi:hypothetical protein